LRREIFTKPDELDLGPNQLLQFVLPLYGLTEGGDYWEETLSNHHENDLNMRRTKGDFSLFFKIVANRLVGLSGSYVGDLVRAGALNFKEDSNRKTQSRFEVKPNTENNFAFTGIEVTNAEKHKSLSQKLYIERLQFVLPSSSFSDLSTIREKLAWASHTRPNISFAVSQMAQTTIRTFKLDVLKLANKVVHHLKADRNRFCDTRSWTNPHCASWRMPTAHCITIQIFRHNWGTLFSWPMRQVHAASFHFALLSRGELPARSLRLRQWHLPTHLMPHLPSNTI
jgi:hypothetical protein